MAGRDEPPEGTPEGLPSGGEDEYRSVVFDESFIRAARLQEFSAQERMGHHARAVRSRSGWPRRGAGRLLVALSLLGLAFGTVVFMGTHHPYRPPPVARAEELHTVVVPLAPRGAVPGGTPAGLIAHSPAAAFRTGASGVNPPGARATAHFAYSEVLAALKIARQYVIESSLDPGVLMGGPAQAVRDLIAPAQYAQFNRSLAAPSADGRHAATGWLVRFDPAQVALASSDVRVAGELRYAEAAGRTLEVVADHTFVYSLRPAGPAPPKADGASLFTVHREVHFRFGAEDLRLRQAQVTIADVEAGPQSCTADTANRLRPLLAGRRAAGGGPPGTDPYATGQPATALCGTLAATAQPVLPDRR
ncbi:SCO2583 family membrane protein [Streptomyces sp. NBC_00388]|uniref:SCO2583 family membrane protein n=1 Tax=Streptomyces sp. NBC_00388 TaxID=2975735 RepID=UPI002E213F89